MRRTMFAHVLVFVLGCACATAMLATEADSPRVKRSSYSALGQRIFNDPSLSADGTTSCASCHQPGHAYEDGRAVSRGAFGRQGTRNTPSLLTITESDQPLFWDGRRHELDEAVIDPFRHPAELGLGSDAELAERLQTATYREAFTQAFGRVPADTDDTLRYASIALVSFIYSLPRPMTAFDQYRAGGDVRAMSHKALVGLRIFTGKAGCATCHQLNDKLARFTDEDFHSTGVGLGEVSADLPRLLGRISEQSFTVAALGREIGMRADMAALGRFAITHRPEDVGLFRTPSLRYVADTAPYMHDGSIATLAAAVDQEIYWRGLSGGQSLSLTVSEREDLIAFLQALSMPRADADTGQGPVKTP